MLSFWDDMNGLLHYMWICTVRWHMVPELACRNRNPYQTISSEEQGERTRLLLQLNEYFSFRYREQHATRNTQHATRNMQHATGFASKSCRNKTGCRLTKYFQVNYTVRRYMQRFGKYRIIKQISFPIGISIIWGEPRYDAEFHLPGSESFAATHLPECLRERWLHDARSYPRRAPFFNLLTTSNLGSSTLLVDQCEVQHFRLRSFCWFTFYLQILKGE